MTDPLTALGIILRRPIPTGETLVDWLLDEEGLPEFCDALLGYTDEEGTHPYGWHELPVIVHDLSRGSWSPSAGYLQSLYARQGGQLAEQPGPLLRHSMAEAD